MPTPFDKRIFWIHWSGSAVGENTIEELVETVKQFSPNVAGIAIKTSDGEDWQARYDDKAAMEIKGPDDILKWTKALARRGLQTYLWHVVRGRNVQGEINVVTAACRVPGVRAMILDVEDGALYFGGQSAATARALASGIKAGAPPGFHLALNFDARGNHPANIHINEWLPNVQSLHPMVYHWHFSEGTRGPTTYIEEAMRVCKQWNMPVVPMLQAYPDPSSGTRVPEDDVLTAGIYSFQKGATGISYFRLGTAGTAEFRAVSKINPNNIPPDGLPPDTQKRVFQVVTPALNVRTEPSTEAKTLLPSEQLRMGERVEAIATSRTERVGFVWWQHRTGWSAERNLSTGEVLMADINQGLPAPAFVFQRLPLDLNTMRWFYYYGNTVFAFLYGRANNYPGYSQGLHGGLDFGHPGGAPVYAGVNGIFDYSGSERAFGPNRVDVIVGNHLIIYGHVANPIRLARGTPVTPDTIVGYIDNGAKHLHLEIRYDKSNQNLILNPLTYMTNQMFNELNTKFPPVGDYSFYRSSRWERWLTPFDQPTIVRGGPVIGPTA
ncbi:MAG: M23 family metallopeptidase [Anaerolineae bacterium]|nr:M23 family metallopeptidase [Anaerolineae bacterium]